MWIIHNPQFQGIYILVKEKYTYETDTRDFPAGPAVKNLPYNAGDVRSIPGQGTKIPHAAGQLSLCATTTEPARLS